MKMRFDLHALLSAIRYAPLLVMPLLAGCSLMVPGADQDEIASAPNDSQEVIAARQTLRDEVEKTPLVRHMQFDVKPGDVRAVTYTDPRSDEQQVVQLVLLLPNSINVSYSPGNGLEIPAWKVSYTEYQSGKQYFWLSSSWTQSDAQAAADALRVLTLDARRNMDEMVAARVEAFKATCQSWSAQQIPPMPQDALEHTALAESAYREGDLDKAADEYQEVFKLYPCYPDGLLKQANILGRTGWYLIAIENMHKYLFLVPNDPNAGSLQNQIRDWQGRMGD